MKGFTTDNVVIEARKISKHFPGVRALHEVDLNVYAGKVNAVVGENGAGKSTLMNILSGVYTEFDGELLFNGQKVVFKDTTDARQVGISMIHQELQLVPNISILDLLNVSPFWQQVIKGLVILLAVIIDKIQKKKEI